MASKDENDELPSIRLQIEVRVKRLKDGGKARELESLRERRKSPAREPLEIVPKSSNSNVGSEKARKKKAKKQKSKSSTQSSTATSKSSVAPSVQQLAVSETLVTFSDLPGISKSSSNADSINLASLQTLPEATVSAVFQQPISENAFMDTGLVSISSNRALIADFERFSIDHRESRERSLRRECVAWMILTVAIAFLFYCRCERILSAACNERDV